MGPFGVGNPRDTTHFGLFGFENPRLITHFGILVVENSNLGAVNVSQVALDSQWGLV